MKILIPTGKSKNAIVTIAIGDEYYNKWINNSYPSWKRYCRRFDLGLIVHENKTETCATISISERYLTQRSFI